MKLQIITWNCIAGQMRPGQPVLKPFGLGIAKIVSLWNLPFEITCNFAVTFSLNL